jgi:acetyl-CoA acetyltransferase
MDAFNRAIRSYAVPHGFGGANGLFGILQRKHMETYGTTREQLGRIAVDQRANAARNPNALLRGPMSLEDYLNARPIADPLRLYDCVLPCAGAEAVIVAPLERAPAGKGVRVLAGRERHNHAPGEVAPLSAGFELFRDALYAEAGYGPEDMAFVQAYDDYPITGRDRDVAREAVRENADQSLVAWQPNSSTEGLQLTRRAWCPLRYIAIRARDLKPG